MYLIWNPDTQAVIDLVVPTMLDWAVMTYPEGEIYATAATERPATLPSDAVLVRDVLTAYAARRRYELEIGGAVEVGGVTVPTDERTRSIVTAAFARAAADPAFSVRWKVSAGVYVDLDAPAILAIGPALMQHVQDVFDRNELADAAIAAGTATTPADVEAILVGEEV